MLSDNNPVVYMSYMSQNIGVNLYTFGVALDPPPPKKNQILTL